MMSLFIGCKTRKKAPSKDLKSFIIFLSGPSASNCYNKLISYIKCEIDSCYIKAYNQKKFFFIFLLRRVLKKFYVLGTCNNTLTTYEK